MSRPVNAAANISEVVTAGVKLEDVVTPARCECMGLIVTIIDVAKLKGPDGDFYLVSLTLSDGKTTTRPFLIWCRDTKEFAQKVRAEAIKFRSMSRALPRPLFHQIVRGGAP